MDIWNALSKEISSPIGPCGIGSNPNVFHLNRRIKHKKSKLIYNFLCDYYDKHDLAHLYALHRACIEVIEATTHLIINEFYESENDFRQIVESELGCFKEISTIICLDDLIHEFFQAANGEHWSEGILNTPKNMKLLGELSLDIQKRIESGSWEPPEMTHAYMCSLTIGNYKRFDYESFTYQLSRKIECEETINNFIPYLQRDASGRELLYGVRNSYEAEVLRLIQWAEIGNVDDYVKVFCNSINIKNPPPIDTEFDYNMRRSLSAPFALFRSDFALEYLDEKLTQYLFSCQLWLQNIPTNTDNCNNILLHIGKMIISAVYLFGAHRVDVNKFEKSVLKDAASYLQTQQLPDAAFLHRSFLGFNHLELNAMVVHALWISEAHGWKRSVQRIYEWIVGELDIYGTWYDFRFDGAGYLTCLILDTFELIEGGDIITFSMPLSKKKNVARKIDNTDGITKSGSGIVPEGNVYNIFGNTFNSDKAKPKKKKKTNPKKNEEFDDKTEPVIWEGHKKAIFLMTNNGRFLFKFADNKPIRLGFERVNHPPRLLGLFCGHPERNSEHIKKALETNDSASHRVHECNKLIGRELEKKGFLKCPKGFMFIEQTKRRGIYRTNIPVLTLDEYERSLHKAEEVYFDDREFTKYKDNWD